MPECCWICGLPMLYEKSTQNHDLKKSLDHVGNGFRFAHCWCNSRRGSRNAPLTHEIVSACRNHMWSVHGEWLRQSGAINRSEREWNALQDGRWADDGGCPYAVPVEKRIRFMVP